MSIKAIARALSLLLMMCVAGFSQASPQYKLNSGDILKISVFGEPDLTIEEIRLNDAGTFTYPFIGEINAKGKTTGEIQQLITEELKKGFLQDPRVSVSVNAYREFYISGEVKEPGGYPYQPGLTLDRAIALAGGLTERASTKRITVIRGGDQNRTIEKASLDTQVLPGDTITIEQGFF
jgi:polysaccharide export outer membrane protein